DSLRQARSLLGELRAVDDLEPVVTLKREVESLQADRDQRVARAAALARLATFGWEDALATQRDDVERLTFERSGAVRSQASEQADAALARWFDSDASFASLLRDGLGPVLGRYRDEVAAIASEVTQTVLGSDVSVATMLRAHREDVARSGVEIAPVARKALTGLAPTPKNDVPRLDVPVAVVQVKKSIWDLLLFRSQAKVRRRLLGPDDAPEKPIPRRIKQKRLGAARVMLGEVLRARFARF